MEINPDSEEAYLNRGEAKHHLGNYLGAIADYTKALKINPDSIDAYINRGISKENQGDIKGACADWRKASSLGDKEAAIWVKNQC